MEPRVIVHYGAPAQAARAGRTRRSLQLAGITEWEESGDRPEDWRALLAPGGPVLLCRAGAWLVRPAGFGFPRPSATGRGLFALGAWRPAPGGSAPADAPIVAAWEKVLAATGGDFSRLPAPGPNGPAPVPEPPLLYLDGVAVQRLAELNPASLRDLLSLAARELRLVHFAPLDAHDDSGLRVFQVITALHRGGAERLTLDLLASLPAAGVRARLATMGRSLRATFPLPPDTLELESLPARGPAARIALLARTAKRFGADLAHAHLLSGEDVRNLAATGLPVVVTVHNTRAGWPAGLAELLSRDALLLAACSNAVARDLRAHRASAPIRTVWNGINLEDFRPTPERAAAGRNWRRDWGFGDADLVLLAVANPRPQKRLHLLPPILAAVQQQLAPGRNARLVLVGEGIPGNPEATASRYQFQAEMDRLDLAPHIRTIGSVSQIAEVLAAADVLVSTSAHEGLSLAQLEALAAGLPVVTTAVGGAEEIARDHPDLHLLPADAPAAEFARVIASFPASPSLPFKMAERAGERRNHPSSPPPNPGSEILPLPVTPSAANRVSLLAPGWNRATMAARYEWLYRRALAAAPRQRAPRGLWLITNNFSTGGAQSSARRLLTGLAAQGIAVRAAVVEEHPDNPTPGHRDLAAHHIPVFTVPFPASQPAANSNLEDPTATRCRPLLDALDADPPEAVLFWNLRPAFKILLADALLDVPVFDVSPGEMYFESLATFFARPRPGLPYRDARDYGERLAGVIVKYAAEAPRAAELLGAPVTVIPNGVSIPPSPAPTRPAAPEIVFGTAARIHPRKRLEDLLAAFRLALAQLPKCRLLIAGGVETGCETYAAELKTSVQDLPVEWLGELTDLSPFHKSLDIFVMISEPAGCPNASLEAMAAGLPVIATDWGGAAEQIRPGLTGLLAPPRDTPALAAALIELATNPVRRQELATAARAHIQAHFSLDRMVNDYRRICGLTPDPSPAPIAQPA